MPLDTQMMVRIAQTHYGPAVAEAFGEEGTDALRSTLQTIRDLYGHVEPELISGSLIVAHPVPGEPPSAGEDILDSIQTPASSTESDLHADVGKLARAYDADARAATTVVGILPNGHLRLFKGASAPDVAALSRSAIVYTYSGGQEFFFVDGARKVILNPSRGVHLSVFAIPTFRELDDALDDYKVRFVKTSRCPVFVEVWENDARLVFRNKPESTMRRSLAHHLSVALRGDAEVHQEKVVDESHPVDVEVTWPFAKRTAIIEIKWLGDSRTPTGKLTSYRDARANEGAKQLAEYLDAKATQSPTYERTGYLVVIDGRRGGIKPETTSISQIEAMVYANREISFDPAYHEHRDDFAEPIRMFAEPALAACRLD
jgi:hypothetical protein